MVTFLELINEVDNVPLDFDFNSLYKLLLPNDPRPHGYLIPSVVSQMPWSADFAINHDTLTIQLLDASNGQDTAATINRGIQKTIDASIEADTFAIIHGTHSEMFRILGANHFVYLERFAAPLFGITGRGAHMTAYVRTASGLKIWIPKRSAYLFTYPGKLDTTVAGGVKADNSPSQCIVAEANEEASLPCEFVEKYAKATGTVSYVSRKSDSGLVSPTLLYVYDIELPESMVPKPQDDEVEGFYLMSVDEVKHAMRNRKFKNNCNLVMLDFFVRHGIITQENEEDYLEIVTRLRRKLPVPVSPEHRTS